MNWRMITLLADFGFLTGALATLGMVVGKEWLLWLLFALAASLWLAKKAPGMLFQHGFAVGLLASLFSAVIAVIFFDAWSQFYPAFDTDGALPPKLYLILTSMLTGSAYGALLGGMTLAAHRLFFQKK